MRIAISSKSGCGNSTVTKLVSEALGCKMINFTFRQLAEEKGIDFRELSRMAETDYEIDRELDRRQVEMAMSEKDCVLGSRLAIWMLKDADFKVFLTASDRTRAERIVKREGGSVEEKLAETVDRDERDSRRYMAIYGIDNSRPEEVADLIIDTENKDARTVVRAILDAVGKNY